VDRTTLVAAVALGLGLLLAGGGSVILAHARAAVRADRPQRGSITQFPAALSALLGFLLTSVSGAVLCWRLVPERGGTAVWAAIVAGVILFALVGAGFARVADRVEERRLLKVPDEVHRPISPPPRRAALTAAAPATEERARPAARALPRPRPPAESTALGYATPLVPVPPRTPVPDAPPPAIAAPEPPAPEPPAPDRTAPGPDHAAPHVPAQHDPAPDPPPRAPENASTPPETTAPTSDDPRVGYPTDFSTPTGTAGDPAPTVEAAEMTSGDPRWGDLDAGWMYHDESDDWFLAVGTAGGSCTLLGLPSFALIDPDGPEAPDGELTRAGAAELTVLPDDPDTPLTDENSVN